MTTAPSSIPHEDCTAEKLILKEEIIERARNLKSRTRVSLFNNTTLMRLFSNFLTHAAADPLIDDKLTHMSPLITKSAKKSLQVGVRDFVADLLAEVECIAEECDSLWRRRKVPAPLSELRAELAKLTRAKRTGLDLQVRRSMAELYERDSFARSVGRETVNAAMKRIGADKLGLRSEYASLYENITDSESVQADSESVQADSSSGSPNCETVQVVASLIVNETNK